MSVPELTVGEVNYNSIELKWEDSENDNNNKKRKLFHVQLNRARARSPCPGGPTLDPLTNYQGYSQQYVFKGLEPMTQYLCRLRVMESDTDRQGGGWSEPITVCTANEPPSGAELHKAVSRQDLEKVRKILQENSTVVEVMDKFGLTPLMVAAQKGFIGKSNALFPDNKDKIWVNFFNHVLSMYANFTAFHFHLMCVKSMAKIPFALECG